MGPDDSCGLDLDLARGPRQADRRPAPGVIAILLLVSCAAPLPPGVLLVTIDTWRADHLRPELTPNAWAVASQGRRYTDAWSPIGLTTAAHASLFTGLTPPAHGLRGNNHHGYVLEERFDTVAERFARAGFDTAAFVSAWPAGPAGGLAQGFATFDGPAEGERPTHVAVEGALAWLKERDGPWFLWVHAYDPHGPYAPPEEDRAAAGGAGDAGRYAAEVHAADRLLGPLYRRALEAGGGLVITADHGEIHGEERCGWQHERSSAPEVLRVPLIVAGPGVEVGLDDTRVGLTDLAPTLLKLGGLPPEGQPLPRPAREVWVGESGLCDPRCAPGCAPEGFAGKDRVVYSLTAFYRDRPGVLPVGDPALARWLDFYPPAQPPPGEAAVEQGRILGYIE